MIILALVETGIAGVVILHRELIAGTTSLERIYVAPAHRRWGIARGLLRQAHEQARAWKTDRLIAEVAPTDRSLSFFLQMGFRVCGFRNGGPSSILFLSQDIQEVTGA